MVSGHTALFCQSFNRNTIRDINMRKTARHAVCTYYENTHIRLYVYVYVHMYNIYFMYYIFAELYVFFNKDSEFLIHIHYTVEFWQHYTRRFVHIFFLPKFAR